MVYFLELKVHWIPSVSIPAGLGVIIMTRDTNVQEARCLCRGEDREKNRNCPPI